MELKGRVAVVTGGGSGIGRALCHRFAAEGARAVVVADLDEAAAAKVAEETKTKSPAGEARAAPVDVADEAQVSELVRQVEDELGPIDLFFSNAGLGGGGGVEATDETWDRLWRVHVMAHVYAARAVLPGMLARGEGYLLHTASAAGLLTNLGNAAYSVTKHATVALAEWLAITYGDAGIRVSCLCPQGVRTPMLLAALDAAGRPERTAADTGLPASAVLAAGGLIEPDDVAEAVVAAVAEERFLILPHPEVAEYLRRKGADPERWLRGMRRMKAQVAQAVPRLRRN